MVVSRDATPRGTNVSLGGKRRYRRLLLFILLAPEHPLPSPNFLSARLNIFSFILAPFGCPVFRMIYIQFAADGSKSFRIDCIFVAVLA
jgi:hypothetical protein